MLELTTNFLEKSTHSHKVKIKDKGLNGMIFLQSF